MKIEEAIEKSLKNIAKYGDTDIFPFPLEKLIFHDMPNECKEILFEMHNDFYSFLEQRPPSTLEALTQVGYTGFRWATQIEPFWNAYYLSLVISIAEEIEKSRVAESEEAVFSYRYSWDDDSAKIFSNSSWQDYRKKAFNLSKNYKYVVVTDIADFYPRIYHHRLENALNRLDGVGDVPRKIMKLLNAFSKNVSYGLPVGGPASRLLSELCLDSTDKLLLRSKVKFCRYADDYSIFCEDKASAYRILVLLSKSLYNEGLTLQKTKTKILSTEEFQSSIKYLDPKELEDSNATDEQKLLNITLRYDPYSATADDDYESLKKAVSNVDIIGILGREVAKTNIDSTITKQAIRAIHALSPVEQYQAIRTLLGKDNLEVLAPVFTAVMKTARAVYDNLPSTGQELIDNELIEIYESNSYLLSVDINMSFYLQVLAQKQSSRKEEIFIEVYNESPSPFIKRLIILAMANWKCYYWLTGLKQNYSGLSEWEKRYFICVSYILGDEGKHWRDNVKKGWNKVDIITRDWSSKRNNEREKWIPM